MTEKELINSLNDTVAEHVRRRTAALTAHNEIATLKAQVNCLRDELRATHDFLWKAGVADYIARDIEKALEVTPEQCLAELKAKAIEEYKQEQAEMKQMELATKLMVSSI